MKRSMQDDVNGPLLIFCIDGDEKQALECIKLVYICLLLGPFRL
jgi:hypothetical protein